VRLAVLTVAFPLAPVRPDTAGGAEQVAGMIDAALMDRGHRSIVLAAEGSITHGLLVTAGRVEGVINDGARALAYARYRTAIETILDRFPVDVIHMHGHDFADYLPRAGVPVLVTLHLPLEMYSPDPLAVQQPGTFFQCVSEFQRKAWPQDPRMLPVIPNGVELGPPPTVGNPRSGAVALGRICPEKGFDIALRAAKRAGVRCTLAGAVFAYEAHQRYYDSEIVPLLDGERRFIGLTDPNRKRRLLSSAQCLLAPSMVRETSSLVAMEALACGTPVIAFPNGALPEIVEHGRTGFLVRDEAEMADAILRAGEIDPAECRKAAEERFSFQRTADGYMDVYQTLAHNGVSRCAS
jgi:glycosyltransferase involved in cell wall biosynthesis